MREGEMFKHVKRSGSRITVHDLILCCSSASCGACLRRVAVCVELQHRSTTMTRNTVAGR